MAKAKQKAIHRFIYPEAKDGKWTWREHLREVTVLAVVDGWAMIRRPRAVPYVARVNELDLSPVAPVPATEG